MKKVKLMMMALVMSLMVVVSFGQEKIEKKEKFKTELTAFNVEFSDGYYVSTLKRGYQYPSIKKGFYTVGFFLRYNELVKLYEELINVSNSEDGEYRLSVNLKGIRNVKKNGDVIELETKYFINHNAYYKYSDKIYIKHLESDLKLIKEEFVNYNNK